MSNYDHKFSSIYYPFGPYLYHAHLYQQFIKDLLEKTKEVFNVEEIDDITKTEASVQKMKDQVSFFVEITCNP